MRGWDFGGEAAEFVLSAFDLAVQLRALPAIQLDGGSSQSPVGPAEDGHHDFQVAQQRSNSIGGRRIDFTLSLRFQKQLRLLQNPLADGWRSLPPSGIQLPGLSAAESVLG